MCVRVFRTGCSSGAMGSEGGSAAKRGRTGDVRGRLEGALGVVWGTVSLNFPVRPFARKTRIHNAISRVVRPRDGRQNIFRQTWRCAGEARSRATSGDRVRSIARRTAGWSIVPVTRIPRDKPRRHEGTKARRREGAKSRREPSSPVRRFVTSWLRGSPCLLRATVPHSRADLGLRDDRLRCLECLCLT